jgi:hypothetical protein
VPQGRGGWVVPIRRHAELVPRVHILPRLHEPTQRSRVPCQSRILAPGPRADRSDRVGASPCPGARYVPRRRRGRQHVDMTRSARTCPDRWKTRFTARAKRATIDLRPRARSRALAASTSRCGHTWSELPLELRDERQACNRCGIQNRGRQKEKRAGSTPAARGGGRLPMKSRLLIPATLGRASSRRTCAS